MRAVAFRKRLPSFLYWEGFEPVSVVILTHIFMHDNS